MYFCQNLIIQIMNKPKCPTIEEFKKVLKKHDLKATPQRLAVHEAMISLGHASADMVTEAIAAKGTTKVTVASVYNILPTIRCILMSIHSTTCICTTERTTYSKMWLTKNSSL